MTEHELDLRGPQTIHVIGVGGAGMSAIASVLVAMGHDVSGSDLRGSPGLDRLAAEGVDVHVGHHPDNIPADATLVTRSTAVPDHNSEVRTTRQRGVRLANRAELLAALTRVRPTIAVAGTHGKTTTASMLALVLVEAGLDPSFVIGGELNEIGSGAVWAEDPGWFIVEADESDGTFLALDRSAAIVTSVEPDHLAHYGSVAALEAAFATFAAGVDGPVVVCRDDPGAAALGAADLRTYGTGEPADVRIVDPVSERSTSRFGLEIDGVDLGSFLLGTPGLHNVANAAGAAALALAIGVDPESIRRALARFTGVARRFQFRGEAGGVTFIDDYAHLPAEVEAAVATAAGGGWDRVVCVFQPHRYTRTADLSDSFGPSFGAADLLVVANVYSSGEEPIPGVTGQLIADAVTAAGAPEAVVHLPHRDDLVTYLLDELSPGDCCLTLGAGDLTTLPDELLAGLERR